MSVESGFRQVVRALPDCVAVGLADVRITTLIARRTAPSYTDDVFLACMQMLGGVRLPHACEPIRRVREWLLRDEKHFHGIARGREYPQFALIAVTRGAVDASLILRATRDAVSLIENSMPEKLRIYLTNEVASPHSVNDAQAGDFYFPPDERGDLGLGLESAELRMQQSDDMHDVLGGS